MGLIVSCTQESGIYRKYYKRSCNVQNIFEEELEFTEHILRGIWNKQNTLQDELQNKEHITRGPD